MAEGIEIDGGMRLHTEFFQEELSSLCHIADHGFTGMAYYSRAEGTSLP